MTAPPTRADYRYSRLASGDNYENQVLYAMCFDRPEHGDPFVTAGKMLMIGRVYSASPERKAGKAAVAGENLFTILAERLAATHIDERLAAIPFETRLSEDLVPKVLALHGLLNTEVREGTHRWSVTQGAPQRVSFASKYLHFHRPNAFPLFDRYACLGLASLTKGFRYENRCSDVTINKDYQRFVGRLLHFVAQRSPEAGWTPRSLDTMLVNAGREVEKPRAAAAKARKLARDGEKSTLDPAGRRD
jgi:hypothetical protein